MFFSSGKYQSILLLLDSKLFSSCKCIELQRRQQETSRRFCDTLKISFRRPSVLQMRRNELNTTFTVKTLLFWWFMFCFLSYVVVVVFFSNIFTDLHYTVHLLHVHCQLSFLKQLIHELSSYGHPLILLDTDSAFLQWRRVQDLRPVLNVFDHS